MNFIELRLNFSNLNSLGKEIAFSDKNEKLQSSGRRREKTFFILPHELCM